METVDEIRRRVREAAAARVPAVPRTQGGLIDALFDDLATMRAQGLKWREIAEILEQAGVTSPNEKSASFGRPFDAVRLRMLFRDVSYRRHRRTKKRLAAGASGSLAVEEGVVAGPISPPAAASPAAGVSTLLTAIEKARPAPLPSEMGKQAHEEPASSTGLEKFTTRKP